MSEPEARWAFLDPETGDWIEVQPGVVHTARECDAKIDVEGLAAVLHAQHDDYRCGGPRWHEAEAAAIARDYEARR